MSTMRARSACASARLPAIDGIAPAERCSAAMLVMISRAWRYTPCTGSQVARSATFAWPHTPRAQRSSVQGSSSSSQNAPSPCGGPGAHPAASAAGYVGKQIADAHASLTAHRASTGSCTHVSPRHASAVHAMPSSSHGVPSG
jgi:hypothetical protein